MKRIFLPLLACTALADPVPVRFAAEAAAPQTFQAAAYRGETLDIEARLTLRGAPLAVAARASATMHWQTNGMGAAWWSAPASVTTSGLVRARWTPAMDCGADAYRVFLGVADGGSNLSYRANMLLRMVGSPGETPNALPLPTPCIDFAKVAVTNAPWGDGGGTDGEAVTNIVEGIVMGKANNPFIPDWGGYITNRMGYVGFPEGYPLVDIAQTNGTGGITSRLIVMPDKVFHSDGTNSNYYHFPHVSGTRNLHQTLALQSDLPDSSDFLRTTGEQELAGTLTVSRQTRGSGGHTVLGASSVTIDNEGVTVEKPDAYGGTTYGRSSITHAGNVIDLPGASGTFALVEDVAGSTDGVRNWVLTSYGEPVAWMAIDGDLLGIYSCTNAASGTNTLWESSSAMGGQLANVAQRATNNTVRITALEARPDLTSWGDYAPDGSPNPDAEAMVYLNKALTLMGSGFSWATSGSYACLCQSGSVAFHTETDGEIRIGLDVVSNYFGMVQGGSVTVGCRTDGIRVEGSGDNTIVHLLYAYAGGDFPVVKGAVTLAGDWTELSPVWTDYGDGTAEAAVPGNPFRFFKALSSRQLEARFESKAPAAFPGGIYGNLESPPVKFDSVITIQSGGHTYRIPAEMVQ